MTVRSLSATTMPKSVALKTEWAMKKGFRGVFFWQIAADRLPDGTNPLQEASRKKLDESARKVHHSAVRRRHDDRKTWSFPSSVPPSHEPDRAVFVLDRNSPMGILVAGGQVV